ncbi:MAG: nickel-dependent lactate racemase [Selenomonadaceae bacterium]|nr:nickel-dependent lactate racemase [Selenomonadaceae bacterium]
MKMNIPYHKSHLSIEIPDENFVCALEPAQQGEGMQGTQEEIVENALANPIGSPKLEELVAGKKRMVIISSDHTRPVPSRVTMPILLKHIRAANPEIEITILIATGFHRPTTHEELVDRYGEKIVNEEHIVVHRAFDDEMADLGTLPSGGKLLLNKVAIDTDLLISEGFIEPHFFAGFSGGRKSILPGIASGTTVMANHCSEFIASDHARTGILEGNPIHKDMLYAAQQAKLAFILNVVINAKKEVIAAFAGDSVKAHEVGCEFVGKRAEIRKNPTDIVITTNGGYPLDQNIYQAVKGMTAAEANCKEGGVIIMVAACNDGHGGESFCKMLTEAPSPRALLDRFAKIPRNETNPDQWEAQILARILDKFTVILVTDMCDPQMIRGMHIQHAMNFDEALKKAFELKGPKATVSVIPDGVSVVVR